MPVIAQCQRYLTRSPDLIWPGAVRSGHNPDIVSTSLVCITNIYHCFFTYKYNKQLTLGLLEKIRTKKLIENIHKIEIIYNKHNCKDTMLQGGWEAPHFVCHI